MAVKKISALTVSTTPPSAALIPFAYSATNSASNVASLLAYGSANQIFCMSAAGSATEWVTDSVLASSLWVHTPGYGNADQILCMSAAGSAMEWRTDSVVASSLWVHTPGYGAADQILCMSAAGSATEWRTDSVVASSLWVHTPGYGDASTILCMSAAGSATEWLGKTVFIADLFGTLTLNQAISSVATANVVKGWAADASASNDDTRLFVQSEKGTKVILGNDQIQFFSTYTSTVANTGVSIGYDGGYFVFGELFNNAFWNGAYIYFDAGETYINAAIGKKVVLGIDGSEDFVINGTETLKRFTTNLDTLFMLGLASSGVTSIGSSVSFWNGAYTGGDARLFIQSELGKNIVLGNNELQLYNLGSAGSADYEYGFEKWTGNVLTIGTSAGGTGVLRNITVSGGLFTYDPNQITTDGGTINVFQILPTYNQAASSGTSNYDLVINRTETAVGSGTQRFASFQVGSTERAYVSVSTPLLSSARVGACNAGGHGIEIGNWSGLGYGIITNPMWGGVGNNGYGILLSSAGDLFLNTYNAGRTMYFRSNENDIAALTLSGFGIGTTAPASGFDLYCPYGVGAGIVNFITTQTSAQTTNAVTGALQTLNLADSSLYFVESRVVARCTTGTNETSGAAYKLNGAFVRRGAGVVQIGVTTMTSYEDVGGWDAAFLPLGNTVIVSVTGSASDTISWHVTTQYQRV